MPANQWLCRDRKMNIDETKEKLVSKKSKDRRRAAKEIEKNKLADLADILYQAYKKEVNDKRTWETQVAMITALGVINYKEALADIETIVRENAPLDAITSAAATSFVQLSRKSIEDAAPVIELLRFGSVSVISGALKSLAVDQMQAPINEMKEIIKVSWDINKHKDRIGHEFGLIDSRIYIALACWNWAKEETTPFLNHCIDTAYNISRFDKPVKNTNLINVCTNSLAGKISKGYL